MGWWLVAWALAGAIDDRTAATTNDADRVVVMSDGVAVDVLDEGDAIERGFIVIDLGDGWVPRFLHDDPTLSERGEVPYAATYRALAAGDLTVQPHVEGTLRRAGRDRFFELWGIAPTPSVVAGRLNEHERHACHDAIAEADEDVDVALPHGDVLPLFPESREAAHRRDTEILRRRRRGLPEATGNDERLRRLERIRRSVVALQGHLVCDGLLARDGVDGVFGEATARALGLFQRREALPVREGALDDETAARLRLSSRERDFQALLRVVRERVVDALGLIEDGSALGSSATVIGRALDSVLITGGRGRESTTAGAPDVISPMTEAAVRALGVDDPSRAAASVVAWPRRAAIELPPRPAWHHQALELSVVLEGCDDETRRPVMRVLTLHEGAPLTLARLPTTIGGLQREKRADGSIVIVKKRSPTGAFVWRRLWAQPAWYAPPSTPDDELLLWTAQGPVVNEEAIGPGYRSAYGLVMLPHERVVPSLDGEVATSETGIRTHGTGHVRSVVRGGASHGCHRLLPVHAGRLASFLLAHHRTRRDGPVVDAWQQQLSAGARQLVVRRTLRGVRYELDPPIPVQVIDGCRSD